VYTATGGVITGSIGGNSFTDASWTITGTADAGTVQTGLANGTLPVVYNYLVPVITIIDGGSSWTATLLDPSGAQWAVGSTDYSVMGVDASFSGFIALDATLNGEGFGALTAPPDASDLVTPRTILGTQLANLSSPAETSLGTLTISDTTDGAASFNIAAVPIPGTLALLGVGGLIGWRLRPRTADA
jgi:hypothetical protein